jgi:polyisoprenoid-binding protein YceI
MCFRTSPFRDDTEGVFARRGVPGITAGRPFPSQRRQMYFSIEHPAPDTANRPPETRSKPEAHRVAGDAGSHAAARYGTRSKLIHVVILIAWILALVVLLSRLADAMETYAVDAVHSTVLFRVKHLGVSFAYGRFTDVTGTIGLDRQDPAKGSLEIEVKTESVDTHNSKRDEHLRGPDFFHVKEFPVARFKSKSLRKTGDDAYEATGDFTLHGVTKTITVPFKHTGSGKDPWGGTRVGGEAVIAIKRSEYGVSGLPGGIGDEVTLTVSLEAVKSK